MIASSPVNLAWIEALVLGFVQGLSEFLPISSSGHMSLVAHWLGDQSIEVATLVLFHLGTLIAVFVKFRPDLQNIIRSSIVSLRSPTSFGNDPYSRLSLEIMIACIPTAAIGLTLKDSVQRWSDMTWPVGLGFIASASLCLTAGRVRIAKQFGYGYTAFLIGIAQGIAVLPGISRSAATITCALFLGYSHAQAFRFSFLISIPTILGALLLERHELQLAIGSVSSWIGTLAAAVVGYFALLWLQQLLKHSRFWWFSIYLFPLGIATFLMYV